MSIAVKIAAQYEEFLTATEAMSQFFAGVMDGMKSELHSMAEQAKADMKGQTSAFEDFGNILKSRMSGVTGAVEGIKIAWAQLAVIFEAAHFLEEAATDTVKMTTEAQTLGRTLGISATQASYLRVAIGDVYGTTDQFIGLAKGMDTQLKTNERGMQAFGLQTRDSGGHLKDQQTLILDGLEVLRSYKEGTDRNIAAQVLFGKGVKVSSEMLALNKEKLAEAKEKADALGLAIGADNVTAADKFRGAMNDVHDIVDAVKNAVGMALLPLLTDLATWFRDSGPTAILAIRSSLAIVTSLFEGLALAVRILWELVKAAFKDMVTIAEGFADVFVRLFHGDFEGAKEAAVGAFHTMAADGSQALQTIMDKASETRDSLGNIWSGLLDPKVKDSGVAGGGTDDADTSKLKKPKKDHSAEEAKRVVKQRYEALMEGYRGEEQAAKGHFDQMLEIERKELAATIAMYGEKSKQAEVVRNRIAETERQQKEQEDRLNQMRADATRDLALKQIDIEQGAAETRESMGLMTFDELIAQELDFEQQRYEITRQALADEAAANVERVLDHQATLLKIEELDAQHQAKIAGMANRAAQQQAQKQQQQAQFLGSVFANAANGMIARTMTFKQALGSIFQAFAQQFIQLEMMKLARYVMGQSAMTAANFRGNAMRSAADMTASKQSMAANGQAAGKSIMASAASVFGKVYDAIAGIPYVGPFLAPVMAVAATGAVMGYMGKIASAEGGYDIPAGVNPMTQLHQREMVLPARHADVIRDMADNQKRGGRGEGDTNVHIHANDPRSFREFLRRNPRAMGDAVQFAHRMGYIPASQS